MQYRIKYRKPHRYRNIGWAIESLAFDDIYEAIERYNLLKRAYGDYQFKIINMKDKLIDDF